MFYRYKHVTRPVLKSAIISFADAIDLSITTTFDFQVVCKQVITISVITDCFFVVSTHMLSTTEKRLEIDLKSVEESYCKMEKTDTVFILF